MHAVKENLSDKPFNLADTVPATDIRPKSWYACSLNHMLYGLAWLRISFGGHSNLRGHSAADDKAEEAVDESRGAAAVMQQIAVANESSGNEPEDRGLEAGENLLADAPGALEVSVADRDDEISEMYKKVNSPEDSGSQHLIPCRSSHPSSTRLSCEQASDPVSKLLIGKAQI